MNLQKVSRKNFEVFIQYKAMDSPLAAVWRGFVTLTPSTYLSIVLSTSRRKTNKIFLLFIYDCVDVNLYFVGKRRFKCKKTEK